MLKATYKNKFAEVLQDGLVLGYCKGTVVMDVDVEKTGHTFVSVSITPNGIARVLNMFDCGTVALKKGQILAITDVKAFRHGKILDLFAKGTPTSITRGIGAFEHESVERGKVILAFQTDGDYLSLISRWLKFYDEVPKFGNTDSMVTVKEVKLGVTALEVEEALGLPVTKVELGEKVLYKYKDMTVEFHDGKVSDVR